VISFRRPFAKTKSNFRPRSGTTGFSAAYTYNEGRDDMICKSKLVGVCALAFGAGVLLCCFLPSSAMVFVSAAAITGAGALLIFT